ncbi:MAG: neutral zinc metallopeptidase [Acidimicrobiia bacterium]|nr:neutral zinc metallopeptidase [Acidimicrobiia bacterium]
MVRFRKPVERSDSLHDRRGSPGRRAVGIGGGGVAILIAVLFTLLGGGDAGDLAEVLEGLQGAAPSGPVADSPIPREADPDADLVDFLSVVLDDNQRFWDEVFVASGLQYRRAGLVLFEGFTESGCGGADERYGPHYCPLDENVYIDLGFFRELQTRFGARGDLAPAYVLSHEIAHHVQTVLGINQQVRERQQSDPASANDLSIRMELQADCWAGVWAASVYVDATSNLEGGRVLELEPGEISEALEAAAAVGDDRIQEAATGRIDPESWTHGSAEQRQRWFQTGYETGDPSACDTFTVDP